MTSAISPAPSVQCENIVARQLGVVFASSGVRLVIRNCATVGPTSGTTPFGTMLTVTGSSALVTVLATSMRLHTACVNLTGGAQVRRIGCSFESSTVGVTCAAGVECAIAGCNFSSNLASGVNVACSGSGTILTITGTQFDGLDSSSTPQGTAISVSLAGFIRVVGCSITDCVIGAQCGTSGDTATTTLKMDSCSISTCTQDIVQVGSSTFAFLGGVYDSNALSIANPTNVSFASYDRSDLNTLTIGSTSNIPQPIYNIANGDVNSPELDYQNNYYGNQGTVYVNTDANPTFTATQGANDTFCLAVTGNRANQSALQLFSDSGATIGNLANVRGWTIAKTPTTALLSMAYINNDTSGQLARGQNPVMQLDGFNNQVLFPLATTTPLPTNTVAQLVWAGDTNLYRLGSNALQTDSLFGSSTLSVNQAVVTNSSKQLISSIVTATELANVSGSTSNIQTQLNSLLSTSGGTLTGPLQLPVGSVGAPSLTFTGSLTSGLYLPSADNIGISAAGTNQFLVNSSGVTIVPFTTAGVVHNNSAGLLSSSLIVNADISPSAGIDNTKLATLTTPGLVANSATTATSSNTANAIVSRDSIGGFSAGTITVGAVVATNPSTFLAFTTAGVIHNNSSGLLSSSLIVDADISASAAISNSKLATLVTAGLVSNSATTANSSNVPNTIVLRDASGNFSAGTINSTSVITSSSSVITSFTTAGIVHNDASGNLTSSLIVNADISPTAAIANSKLTTLTTTGLVSNSATTATSSNVANAIVSRDAAGNFTAGTITSASEIITGLSTAGVVHNNAAGVLSTSLIVDADISGTAAISNSKLATLSTPGLVANSATTATSADVASTIVSRDASGNFSAGTITSIASAITSLSTVGVVHNDALGNLSTSLIVDADISATANISTSKLATLVTAGLVSNSATTATSADTANAIVARDASGNFAASAITSSSLVSSSISTPSVTVTSFSTAGVVHNNASGLLTSSLIVNADISPTAGIQNSALATLTTAGLVSNSATTATNLNTANAIVSRDPSGNFTAGTITATQIISSTAPSISSFTTAGVVHNNASGALSSSLIVDADISSSAAIGNTKLATLSLAGLVSNSATTATPLDTFSTIVSRDAAGNFAASAITMTGAIISPFTTPGVIHNNASGVLTSSLIVNADISSSAGIQNSALATLTTAGLVSNSATTATSSNTPSTIVLRDGSGNFSANVITASALNTSGTNTFSGAVTFTGIVTSTNATVSSTPLNGSVVLAGGLGVSGAINSAGTVGITNGTVSSSPTTGALVISGGVGIGGQLSTAGPIVNTNATVSTTASTGALVVTGGAGIGGAINTTGIITTTNATVSTTASTGALVVSGGAGIGGQLTVTGPIVSAGAVTSNSLAVTTNATIGRYVRSYGDFGRGRHDIGIFGSHGL